MRSKLMTTFCAADIANAQLPLPLPAPVPDASHPAPAHALRKLPVDATAESVTLTPGAKGAEQPVAPAVPFVTVQLMPAGDDVILPLPPAPPATVSVYVDALGPKRTLTVVASLSLTEHACALSAAPLHPTHDETTPPFAGTPVSVTVAPVL